MRNFIQRHSLAFTCSVLLAGVTTHSFASNLNTKSSEAVIETTTKAEQQTPVCPPGACKTAQGFSVEIISKGEQAASVNKTPNDRRVELALSKQTHEVATAEKQAKTVVQGDFLVRMPLGGIFWATEDPAITAPRLSISAPQAIKFDGLNKYDARFNYFTNYPAFIEHLTLVVYKGNDVDLIDPLFSSELTELDSHGEISWQVEPSTLNTMIAGDSLRYVLRAFDAEGNMDETESKLIQLVSPKLTTAVHTLIKVTTNSRCKPITQLKINLITKTPLPVLHLAM